MASKAKSRANRSKAAKSKKADKPKSTPTPEPTKKVISARELIRLSLRQIRQNFKTYLIFSLIYAVFLFIFVQGPLSYNVNDIRTQILDVLPEQADSTTLIASVVVGESINVNEVGTIYGFMLVVVFSLAFIYLARSMVEGEKVKIKEGFYRGMYGLIPVLILGVIMLLQLIPAAIGGGIYSLSTLSSVTVTGLEQAILLIVFLLLLSASVYLIVPTIIAFYIATLPNMEPIYSLRTAKNLVKKRRARVLLRLVTGMLFFAAIALILLLIIIALVPVMAVGYWWLIGVISLPIYHTYGYQLYRSLL